MDDLAICVMCGLDYDYMQVFSVHDVDSTYGLTARRINADGSCNLVSHVKYGASAAAASIVNDLRLMYVSGVSLVNNYRGHGAHDVILVEGRLLDHIIVYLSSLGYNASKYGTTFVVVANE